MKKKFCRKSVGMLIVLIGLSGFAMAQSYVTSNDQDIEATEIGTAAVYIEQAAPITPEDPAAKTHELSDASSSARMMQTPANTQGKKVASKVGHLNGKNDE